MQSRDYWYYLPRQQNSSSFGPIFDSVACINDHFLITRQYVGKRVNARNELIWEKRDSQYFRGESHNRFVSDDGVVREFDDVEGAIAQLGAEIIWSSSDDINSANNKAIHQLYDKLTKRVDLSIDTWQWKQTAQLAADLWKCYQFVRSRNPNALKKGYDAYQSARRRLAPNTFGPKPKPIDWRKWARRTGNAWLQFSYGVRPLIQDIHDTLEAMHAPKRLITTIKARGKSKSYGKEVKGYAMAGRGDWTYEGSWTRSVRIQFICSYVVSESVLDTLKRFTTMDPKSFIWENLPFSFVFDWFHDLGGYLSLTEQAYNSTKFFAGGIRTETQKHTCDADVIRGGTYRRYSGAFGWGTEEYSGKAYAYDYRKSLTRLSMSSSPTPVGPSNRLDFSSPWRAMNAISLLLQGFRK